MAKMAGAYRKVLMHSSYFLLKYFGCYFETFSDNKSYSFDKCIVFIGKVLTRDSEFVTT